MQNLWMDVSYNDDGEVNSIVAGCYLCDQRAVANEEDQAKAWLQLHNKDWHEGASMKVEYLAPKKTPSFGDEVLQLLCNLEEPVRITDVAEILGKSYNTTNVAMNRLHKAGLINKIMPANKNQFIYWEAA